MKLVTFEDAGGEQHPGVIQGEDVIRLDFPDMRSLFEMGDAGRVSDCYKIG